MALAIAAIPEIQRRLQRATRELGPGRGLGRAEDLAVKVRELWRVGGSLERFVRQLGRLGPELMQDISDAVALCVGFSFRRP